jgi:hypothetical protein
MGWAILTVLTSLPDTVYIFSTAVEALLESVILKLSVEPSEGFGYVIIFEMNCRGPDSTVMVRVAVHVAVVMAVNVVVDVAVKVFVPANVMVIVAEHTGVAVSERFMVGVIVSVVKIVCVLVGVGLNTGVFVHVGDIVKDFVADGTKGVPTSRAP